LKKVIQFVFAMFLAFLPGIIGVMFTPNGMSNAWYNTMNKSVLTPDGWVFGVAWTILYALIGIGLFIVMRTRHNGDQMRGRAYTLFGIQMVLNAAWTYLFFGAHMPWAALVVVVALLIVAVLMMRTFYRINPRAAYTIVPYVIWLLFATYLNGAFLYLN